MNDQTHLAIAVASSLAMAIRNGQASLDEIHPAAERLRHLAAPPVNARQIALVCPMLNSKDCEYVLHVIEDAVSLQP